MQPFIHLAVPSTTASIPPLPSGVWVGRCVCVCVPVCLTGKGIRLARQRQPALPPALSCLYWRVEETRNSSSEPFHHFGIHTTYYYSYIHSFPLRTTVRLLSTTIHSSLEGERETDVHMERCCRRHMHAAGRSLGAARPGQPGQPGGGKKEGEDPTSHPASTQGACARPQCLRTAPFAPLAQPSPYGNGTALVRHMLCVIVQPRLSSTWSMGMSIPPAGWQSIHPSVVGMRGFAARNFKHASMEETIRHHRRPGWSTVGA